MEPQPQPFSCEMCLSKFNEVNRIPYLLPTCGHTMCASCLSTFLLSNPSGPFTCPFDSTEYQIDHSGVNNFPKNHALLTAMRQDQDMSNPPFVPFIEQQTPRKERTKSLCISSTSSRSSLNAIDKEDQQTASEELQLVVTNKLGHLEQALSQIEAFEQKIYDHVEEAVMTKEKHILELLDQKFAEFHATLDNKKKEMIDRVTMHFSGVRERVKNKQNPRESQYEAKTKVIEWKNIVKKKMSLWNNVKTVEVANEIIEEDETAMVPEVNLWTSRIENVLSLGNLDKLVDKSFMVFDEEGATKAIAALCEFKVMNEESFEKENVFGSAEKSVPKEENSKTDSDTSSPQDMTDRRKFISQLFKAYSLKVDPTFAKEVDKLKIKPKNNPLLLPATSKDKKKKKFMFENFDEFERLQIHCEDFKDKNLSNLAQVLQFFNMLKDLHIILIGCDKVHDISLETLGATLQGLPSLQSLTVEYLSPSPKITDQGLIKFAKKISGSQTLQKISLSFEKLSGATEKGFTNIWDDLALVTSGLTHVKLVVPADVIVTDEGLGRLSVGLKQMTKLQEFELIFNGNDKLSNKGFSQLSESLGKLVNLTALRITVKEQSGNINDRGFSSFIQALAKLLMLKDLSIELPKCYVSNEKFIEFCQALSKLNFLKQLNLNFSWSLLSDGSLMELGKAVACLYSITHLHLDFTACSFSNTGFKELTTAISGLFNLHQLSLDFSWCKDITDEGLLHLVEGISKLSNLNKLEVNLKEARKITESSVMRLCKAVPRSSSIEHLVLNVVNCGRDLNDEAKMRMEDALSTGRRYVNRKISVAE